MSLYKIIARINPEQAVVRLLKDNPDGVNLKGIRIEIGLGIKGTKKVLGSLKEKNIIKEIKIGTSKVFING